MAESTKSTSKKRQYKDEYIKYGFLCIKKQEIDYPQCIICYNVLGNDSLRPSKLDIFLKKCLIELVEKDADIF